MKYNFITIEGNIGAGKTTLAHLLSKHLNARLILEEFADNPFLPKFYENQQQYAFPLELFFMAERYKQLKDLLQTKDMFQTITISDYLFTKCLLFAKVNLPEERELMSRQADATYITDDKATGLFRVRRAAFARFRKLYRRWPEADWPGRGRRPGWP